MINNKEVLLDATHIVVNPNGMILPFPKGSEMSIQPTVSPAYYYVMDRKGTKQATITSQQLEHMFEEIDEEEE